MLRTYLLVSTVLLGLVLVASGAVMIAAGLHTRSEIKAALVNERLNVPDPRILLTYPGARAPEGVEIPKVLIDNSELATAQAEVIRTHTLGITGDKTYSEMDRNDPNRTTYITAVTLQTALHQAHIGFELTYLVMGLGAILGILGISTLVLGLPLIHIATKRTS